LLNLRSPLGQVLGSGSAKDGTEHWWAQRVSAVALLLLGCWFLYSLAQLESFSRGSLQHWIGQPFSSVMLVLLCLTLAWHSALGVQVVLEDYVHGKLIKVLSLMMNKFGHAFLAIAACVAILRITFGAGA
jgi:succinate dehydrogenase / fumarate reductase membrane anchor subunit